MANYLSKTRLNTNITVRGTATLPQTAQTPYFTVTGRVLLTQIVGEVVVASAAGANSLDLWSNPTVGADVALCGATDCDADVAGTLYTITGTLADNLIATTSGAVKAQVASILVAAGTIDLKTTANKAGTTKWTVHWIPLDPNSTVVVA